MDYLEESWKPEKTCCYSEFIEKSPVKAGVKNFPKTLEITEKIEKYLDLARELKKLWKMRVMVTLIVVGAFGRPRLQKNFGKEDWRDWKSKKNRDHLELLRSARIQ